MKKKDAKMNKKKRIMMVRITRAVAAFELDTSKDCIIVNTEE